jgi:hypothetical protein
MDIVQKAGAAIAVSSQVPYLEADKSDKLTQATRDYSEGTKLTRSINYAKFSRSAEQVHSALVL